MFVRMVLVPVGAPTEVPVVDTSTARLAVVAAATAVHERLRSIAHREPHLLGEPIVGVTPVREERPDVLTELFAERRHTSMLPVPPRQVPVWNNMLGDHVLGTMCR
jgi:hypothetical protein